MTGAKRSHLSKHWLLGVVDLIVVIASVGIGLRLTVFAGKITQPAAQSLLYAADGASIRAIRANDGTTAWRVGGPYSRLYTGAGAVLAVQPMQMALLDGQTGQIRWRYGLPTTMGVTVTQVVFGADSVYVAWESGTPGNFTATLVTVRLRDGHLLWQTSDAVLGFVMLLTNDVLVVGEHAYPVGLVYPHTLTVFTASDGTVRWRITQRAETIAPVAVVGTMLLVRNGTILAFDLATGTERWHLTDSPFGILGCVHSDVIYTTVYPNGMSSDPTSVMGVAAYHLSDGSQIWQRILLPHRFVTISSCAGPTLLLGQYDPGNGQAFLYGLDAATGAIRWQHPPAPLSFVDARVGNGAALLTNVAADNTTMQVPISLFDIATGTTHWQAHLPIATTTNAFIEELPYEGTVFVTIGNDQTFTTYALDAATGAIRWHQSLGNLTTPDGMGEL